MKKTPIFAIINPRTFQQIKTDCSVLNFIKATPATPDNFTRLAMADGEGSVLNFSIKTKKIISLLLTSVIFFNILFLYTQQAKAANTIICEKAQDFHHIDDTEDACGKAYYALVPNWKNPALEVKDKDSTKKDITLNWTSPKAPSGPNSELVIKISQMPFNLPSYTNLVLAVDTLWEFDHYELYAWGPNNAFDHVKNLGNTATDGNNHKYTYPATLTDGATNQFTFKIVAYYKFKKVLWSPNSILDGIAQTSGVSLITTLVTNMLQNDLYILSTPRSVDIKNPDTIVNADYSPAITSGVGSYDKENKTGSATIGWKSSKATQDGVADVESYEVYRRKYDTNQQVLQTVSKVSNIELNTDSNKCTTNCGAIEKKAVNNLEPGQSITYEYFIKAKYKNSKIPPNSGFSTYGWKITWTVDKDGNVTTTSESGNTPFDPSNAAENQHISGGETPTANSSKCVIDNCRKSPNSDIPYKYVCEAICWVNEGIMSIINWAFEYMRGAISTETKTPITPQPDKYLNNNSESTNTNSNPTNSSPTTTTTSAQPVIEPTITGTLSDI